MSPALKKKSPGFMVAMALKPKKDEGEPEGFDEEDEPSSHDMGDEGDEDESALADAGTEIGDALGLKVKEPAELSRALMKLMKLHGAMEGSEE